MSGYFILDANGDVQQTDDITVWGAFFQNGNRIVAKTDVKDRGAVSTVFLGLDHGWGGGKPVLWETMIFGGKHDQGCWRYSSKEDAVRGHERIVGCLRDGIDPEIESSEETRGT